MSRIEVITGPMFAGKTEELIRRLTRHQIAGKEVQVYYSQVDTRSPTGTIASHAGSSFDASTVFDLSLATNADVVAFDEAQFYPGTFVAAYAQSLVNSGLLVIVAGLDKDYMGRPFGQGMSEVLAIADDVTKLTAVCMKCGDDATMTQRTQGGTAQIEVGGEDEYEARCRSCWTH